MARGASRKATWRPCSRRTSSATAVLKRGKISDAKNASPFLGFRCCLNRTRRRLRDRPRGIHSSEEASAIRTGDIPKVPSG